ncbi:hypothetical protein SESBI_06992 [Sesbania bispinosa]|nr:hypothetical protein SESBI_06991 [Sesbania bispinosa]KAJ1431753.1 hypothetical protein SESBI_06992 [Sesbania bispinosa]
MSKFSDRTSYLRSHQLGSIIPRFLFLFALCIIFPVVARAEGEESSVLQLPSDAAGEGQSFAPERRRLRALRSASGRTQFAAPTA